MLEESESKCNPQIMSSCSRTAVNRCLQMSEARKLGLTQPKSNGQAVRADGMPIGFFAAWGLLSISFAGQLALDMQMVWPFSVFE